MSTDMPSATRVALDLARSGMPARDAAFRALRGLSAAQLRELAATAIEDNVRTMLRGAARKVERSVTGYSPEHLAEIAQADRERSERFKASCQRAVDIFVSDLKAEWTADLLQTPLRLGDGTETTWGAATLEQHEMRAQALHVKAVSTLETVALHRSAIELLTTTGAACLNEAVAHAPV